MIVFSSRTFKGRRCSESFLHDLCKAVAVRVGLKKEEWRIHRFRDTAATRWLRAGIDVRTVQTWFGHESLATTELGAVQGNRKTTREDEDAVLGTRLRHIRGSINPSVQVRSERRRI